MSFLQAIIIGLIQGVTELFPVSSLGHAVVLPALFGWHNVVAAQTAKESFFLAFLVGLHVATALALLAFYWRDWVAILSALVRSTRRRRIQTSTERLAWLLVVATIPAGLTGIVFEKTLRTLFAKPLAASVFLFLNGLVLLGGEVVRRRALVRQAVVRRAEARQGFDGAVDARGTLPPRGPDPGPHRRLETLQLREAGVIGVAQVLALLAGISRSGITMVVGLVRGLDHEDAARFSFLLATPIILAAGVYKLPDLLGSNGSGVRAQILVGSLVAGVAAYLSVRYLVRYFRSHNLVPFAAYCLVAGALLIVRFTLA